MITIEGLRWPDDVGTAWQHALMHVKSLEVSLALCRAQKRTRTAVQAGGNMGLWPRRMAEVFRRVITFEPDTISRQCCRSNVPSTVDVRTEALGAIPGACGLQRRGLGGHRVKDGDDISVTTVDALGVDDLDLLQLDIEGYEGVALLGADKTIERCRPIIHLELRGRAMYGFSDTDVRAWLKAHGYTQVATAQGSDFIFEAVQ